MNERELYELLISLEYDVEWIPSINRFRVRNSRGWTSMRVDSHSDRGSSNVYVPWLPISYILLCIENHDLDLGEYTRINKQYWPNHVGERSLKRERLR